SVSFRNNYANYIGGAIRLNNQSVFNSSGTVSFVSNEAESGGAIAVGSMSEVQLIDSVSFEGTYYTDCAGGSTAVSSGTMSL
ncbi:unnamed protein product, partial [Ascophyllum nodosum]